MATKVTIYEDDKGILRVTVESDVTSSEVKAAKIYKAVKKELCKENA